MQDHQRAVVKPKRLQPGDTIGIVAPAGPYDPDQLEQGLAVLTSLGYATKLPDGLSRPDGFLAGPDLHRAAFVNAFFADNDVKGIICARGGYGSMRLLNLLDYEAIRNNPKVFVGFSDITALHSAINDRCGLVTFHGPVVTSLSKADPETVHSLANGISSTQPIEIKLKKAEIIREGKAVGRVCGGNLRTLCHLMGTPYAPDFTDGILLVEEINEAPYRLDRMLFQMRLAGCFDRIRGIILGIFSACGDMTAVSNVIRRMFQDMAVPILAGFDIGHGPTNLTLPLGLSAKLDTNQKSLVFEEPGTNP
jgi:muramoyltetrapeptide carboxypeptidase